MKNPFLFIIIFCTLGAVFCNAMHIRGSSGLSRKETIHARHVAAKKADLDTALFRQQLHKKECMIIEPELYSQISVFTDKVAQAELPVRSRFRIVNFASLLVIAGLVTQSACTETANCKFPSFTNTTASSQIHDLAIDTAMHPSHEQVDNLVVDTLWQSQLYTPWRESYKPNPADKAITHSCPFCSQIAEHQDDRHFILKRTDNFIVLLNLFPYNRGHLLIVPLAHIKDLKSLSSQARKELMDLQVESIEILKQELHTEFFNVGINIGKYAGASVPDHLHVHIIPRYEHEGRAFIHTIGQTNVISWDLNHLYEQLVPVFNEQCPVK